MPRRPEPVHYDDGLNRASRRQRAKTTRRLMGWLSPYRQECLERQKQKQIAKRRAKKK